MMQKLPIKRLLSLLAVLTIIGVGAFFLEKKFHSKLYPSKVVVDQTATPLKQQPLAKCKPEDDACIAKNEQIKASQLTGNNVEYAKHQCDGPHACPTPPAESNDAAIAAIRTFTKDETIDIIRMTGINASGIVYYCATDNRCWSVASKTAKVISAVDKK
jgi:hypothetical protein